MQSMTAALEQYQKGLSLLHSGTPTTIVAGKIPDSHICFLDEIFKAGDGLLNSLLTALNEHRYTNEGVTVEIPVISESVEMAAATEVETVPIVTGDMSKKVKVEERGEEPERKEEEEAKIEPKKEEKEPMEEMNSKETVSMDSETEKSILKLRKLSMDYIEKERKKSMELEAITATSITPDANDDFEFSEDDDNEPFDVPDISL